MPVSPTTDPRDLRVSDAEREHVAGLLQKAVGRGLISLDEFTERMDTALASQTRRELNGVLVDLPYVQHQATTRAAPLLLRTGTASLRQTGYWTVPAEITAEAGMGNILVDFTKADCPREEVTLRAACGTGNITVVVPRGWRVVMMEATSRMGSVINKATDPPTEGHPTLRVYGTARLGTIKVRYPRGRES